MIALVTGPPGAGKTYWCVRQIASDLDAGKVVVTNVGLRPDWAERLAGSNPFRWLIPGRRAKVAADYRRRLHVIADLDELLRVRVAGTKEGRATAVLDEAHRWMNARAWKEEGRGLIVGWASAHRHYGFDVYLVTQDALNIDRQVRDLFEYHIRLKNLRKFKVMGVPLFPMNLFVAIWGWHDGAKSIVKRQCYRLTRAAKLYETHALATVDVPADAILLPRSAAAPTLADPPALPLVRPDLQPAPDRGRQPEGAGYFPPDLVSPPDVEDVAPAKPGLGRPAQPANPLSPTPELGPTGDHTASVADRQRMLVPSMPLGPELGSGPTDPVASLRPVPLTPLTQERPAMAPPSAPRSEGASPPHGPPPG